MITFLLSGQTKTHEVKKSVLFVVNDIYKKICVFVHIFKRHFLTAGFFESVENK